VSNQPTASLPRLATAINQPQIFPSLKLLATTKSQSERAVATKKVGKKEKKCEGSRRGQEVIGDEEYWEKGRRK